MCWSKKNPASFQGLEMKNIGLVQTHYSEIVTSLTLSHKVQILTARKDNFGESFACKLLCLLFAS